MFLLEKRGDLVNHLKLILEIQNMSEANLIIGLSTILSIVVIGLLVSSIFNKNFRVKLLEIISKNSKEIILSLVILFALFVLNQTKLVLITWPTKIINNIFGEGEVSIFLLLSCIFIGIGYFIYLMISVIHKLLSKEMNKWFWVTIISIFCLFYIGFLLIGSSFIDMDLKLKLRNLNDENRQVGEINCTDDNGILLVYDKAECQYSPILNNTASYVRFKLENNSEFAKPLEKREDKLTFEVPDNVRNVFFYISGKDKENKSKEYTISYNCGYSDCFLSKDEYDKKIDLWKYQIYILFGIVLFSVPSATVNFSNLLEKSKNKKNK